MKKVAPEEMLWNAVMKEKAVHDCQTVLAASLISQPDELLVGAPIACPRCTSPLTSGTLECPSCHRTLDADVVDAIRNISFEIAYFGVLYRKCYEEDIHEGKVGDAGPTHRYFLPPPDQVLVYLVSVALVSIVGGLAHDAVKALLKAALRKIKTVWQEDHDEPALDRSSAEYALPNASLDDFLQCTEQYLNSMLDEQSTQFRLREKRFVSGLILVESTRIRLESPSASVDEAQIIDRLASDPTNLSPEGKEYVRLALSFRREIQTLETYMKSRAQHLETRKRKGKQQHRKSE